MHRQLVRPPAVSCGLRLTPGGRQPLLCCLRHRRYPVQQRTWVAAGMQAHMGPLQQASSAAVIVGMKLTAALQHAARLVCERWSRWQAATAEVQLRHQVQEQASAALAAGAVFPTARMTAAAAAALRTFTQPSLSFERKWSELQRHLSVHEDIGRRVQGLFNASQASSQVAAVMLAQSGGTLAASYFSSQEARHVIAEEEALKSLVFSHMLSAQA